ncbi:nucleotide sugar dehydrogenase [Prochlorococcus sp. MIT 1223]|uniref:nucleotide sugar dehydrogenase n=1 Tax=Prochlorococcus sp. MIT 1223 TaxID=3096217 RepID=UPI002A7518F3|nr:nucleotide sugar dehydrogenase [Prochlorococcus sp. MIT 1223]
MKSNHDFKNIAVIGAGYIGAVLSAVLADKGFNVTAIDINESLIKIYNSANSPFNEPGLQELINKTINNNSLTASTDISKITEADVILITVGTPLKEDGSADDFAIKSAISSMLPYIKDDQLIILKSTVPPSTTQELVAKPLSKIAKVYVAFCPERLAEGNAIEECKNIPVVVGGVDDESALLAEEFWTKSLGVECIRVENSSAAELVKLADNAWIDLNIALSFELAKVADFLEIDVLPVIKATNSLPKGQHFVNILLPSIGVGGYCLTKDPWFMNAFAESFGSSFKTAVTSRIVNQESPIYSANRLDETLSLKFPKLEKNEIQIGILGLAFKNNTGDCRFTPSLPAIKILLELGYSIKAFDPYVNDSDYALFNPLKRAFSIDEAMDGAHALAFFAGHKEFEKIDHKRMKELLAPGAVIFDGRMYFERKEIEAFLELGFVFKGVGR